MSLTVTYPVTIKRNDSIKLELPNLKSSCLIPIKLNFVFLESKSFDIKLSGKETILSLGEAVLLQSTTFNLSDYQSLICESPDTLELTIKNLNTGSSRDHSLTVHITYEKHSGHLIYHSLYGNLTPDTFRQILCDIRKSGKYINRIILTSSSKLTAITLNPILTTTPEWLQTYNLLADANNQIVINLSGDDFDQEFIDQLRHYELIIPESTDSNMKLGLLIYGFAN
jgi:hypothetical protein